MMDFLRTMKKLLIEIFLILAFAVTGSLIYNTASGKGFPIFKKFIPPKVVQPGASAETIDIDIFNYYRNRQGTIVLDARTRGEYDAGHIPGAHYFGVREFDSLFRERGELLKLGEMIIVYCSGPDCDDSLHLAGKLMERGLKDLFLFRGGVEEWLRSGAALER